MTWDFTTWPPWLPPLFWTGVTVAIAYGIGHVINLIIVPRLVHLAARTQDGWDDILIEEIKRRLPFWSLLIGVWLSLDHWTLEPNVVSLTTKILFGLGALSVTLLVIAVSKRMVVLYGSKIAPTMPVTGLTQNLITLLIAILGLLVILNGLGIQIAPMLTALGIGGLAVALALQEPLGNFFAGFFLTMAGSIRVGDYVRLDSGLEGYVVDFNWRSARIRQLPNNMVLVPNLKLSQAVVINFYLPSQDLAVLVEVGVDYDADLEHVERVTIEVGREVMQQVQGGVTTHEPFIRYHTFGDSSINFSVILRGNEYVDQFLVKHEFVKRLHKRYAQEGITIPFPQRTLSARGPVPISMPTQSQ